jgi:hypothetical protein
MAIYVIAMTQDSNNVKFDAKSPGLGPTAVPVSGKGSDQAVFAKIAMPLGNGFSAGVLLAHETSSFDAAATANPGQNVHYETEWRPSGGFGLAWQPDKTWLFGFRAIFNNDLERRIDSSGVAEGLAQAAEYRLGGSYAAWTGGLVDIGATRLERWNAIAGTHTVIYHPNLGFEQKLDDRLTLRFGLDETSPTAGLSYKFAPFKVDVAYIYNMAHARVGDLFGTNSNSILATLTIDFAKEADRSHPQSMKNEVVGSTELPAAKILK